MPQIFWTHSAWWLIPLLILAGGLGWFYYWKRPIYEGKWSWVNFGLMALRSLLLFLLFVLLLEPVLKTSQTKVEKPQLIVAIDASGSIQEILTPEQKLKLWAPWEKALKEAEEKVDVIRYDFATQLASPNSKLNGTKTNISGVLKEIESRHGYKPIAGLLMVSDGIFNQGFDPSISGQIPRYPIFTVGLGDTTERKDILVSQIRHNDVAFLGNTYPVSARFEARDFNGKEVIIEAHKNGKLVETKRWTIAGKKDFFEMTLQVKADSAGLQRFEFLVSKVEGELTDQNNRKESWIEVLKGKQKILLLSPFPNPDVSAIRQSLSKNNETELTVSVAPDLSGIGKIEDYQLIICVQTAGHRGPFGNLLQQASQAGKSILVIGGMGMNYQGLRDWGFQTQISNQNQQSQEAYPVIQNQFNLFSIPSESSDMLKSVPPLVFPYGNYQWQGTSDILATQRIGQINTQYPLIGFWNSSGRKIGVVMGEGLWRWRMHAYQQAGNHEAFDALFSKITQFLAVKESVNPFQVFPVKKLFEEEEPVIFEGTLKNPAGEYISQPDVEVTVFTPNGSRVPYQMSKEETRYTLQAGVMKTGSYRYIAKTSWQGKEWTSSGFFAIKSSDYETAELQANHGLLRRLSAISGGRFMSETQIEPFIKWLGSSGIKPIMQVERKSIPLIEWPWYYVILLLTATVEWVLRRWEGAV